jgi:hypothetical protein
MSVVPSNGLPLSGRSPTVMVTSFSLSGEYLMMTEEPVSTVHTLPEGSMRMLCGI